ncbi:MAG TPA: diguanylate cyclase [Bryobacteraceae bacterium]|jgi:diguanylate cyclase (GGDEF)-like protein
MDLRVLLIESEPDEMLFLHDVLREIEDGRWLPEWPRIQPLSASTWEEAERIFSSDPPHAILFDLDLAKQGAGTFRRMQAAAPEVPVILVLNSTDEPLAVKLIREGAEDFLLKKLIDCGPLAHALRNAVLRHRLLSSARAAAHTDSLTGLYNRAGFLVSATRDRMLAERLGRRWMVIIAEPRNLTEIAAAFGEQRRDLELMEAADHLRSIVTAADALARIGERHFALTVFDNEVESVEQAWTRIRNAAAERRIELGVSIFHGQNPLTVDAMIEQAIADLPQPAPSNHAKSSLASAG